MPESGDLTLFETHARVVQARLRPRPMLEMPTRSQHRAAVLVNASYDYWNESAEHVAHHLAADFEAHLDTELSTHKGIVAVVDDEVYIAFRGAQKGASHPSLEHLAARDKAMVKRVGVGAEIDLAGEEAIVRGAMAKYGQVDGVYGYSLGGHKVTELARRGVLDDVGEVEVLNPWLGRKDIARGVPANVRIARTVEDFASGPAVALGMRRGTMSAEQVTTVRGIEGMGDHANGHFVAGDPAERGPTIFEKHVEELHERVRARGRYELETPPHAHVAGLITGAASYAAADAVVNAIGDAAGHHQAAALRDAEVGGVGSVVNSVAKAGLVAGGLPTATAVGAELPGAVAGVVVESAAAKGVDKALRTLDSDYDVVRTNAGRNLTEDVVAGAAGKAAAVVATDAVVATAGALGAFWAGGELSAGLGLAMGPAGAAVGAAGGALLGAAAWAVGDAWSYFFNRDQYRSDHETRTTETFGSWEDQDGPA